MLFYKSGYPAPAGKRWEYWGFYCDEILLINLLALGSPSAAFRPPAETFYKWTRKKDSYKGESFIYSWTGSLHTYQWAHAWIKLDMVDKEGVNWWRNSINATLANRQFCIDNASTFRTYGPNSWGITLAAHPEGYIWDFSPTPCGRGGTKHDGTISPSGPAGSMSFTPLYSLTALKYLYLTYPQLWGKYGFRDSINIERNWISPYYSGYGEGISLLMIENFRSGLIWKTFAANRQIQSAMERAGFRSETGMVTLPGNH